MTPLDWIFIAIVAVSMVVGVFRGFIKEAISLGSLLIAVWASFFFAPAGESLFAGFVGSEVFRIWLARIAIFVLVLILGGLVGWLISRFINQVGLTGTDRLLGLMFGFGRGAVLCGLIALAAPYLELDHDEVWTNSQLRPYAQTVADGIAILAPRALDYFRDE
ncbi:MAG: CvpA family protein, partial [Pseudomonadota bacterium]